MKARIYQRCKHGLYWGQIYNEEDKKWKNVTMSCNTRHEAKRELRKWKHQNFSKDKKYVEEFEL